MNKDKEERGKDKVTCVGCRFNKSMPTASTAYMIWCVKKDTTMDKRGVCDDRRKG